LRLIGCKKNFQSSAELWRLHLQLIADPLHLQVIADPLHLQLIADPLHLQLIADPDPRTEKKSEKRKKREKATK